MRCMWGNHKGPSKKPHKLARKMGGQGQPWGRLLSCQRAGGIMAFGVPSSCEPLVLSVSEPGPSLPKLDLTKYIGYQAKDCGN